MSVAILRPAGDGAGTTSTYGLHGYGTHTAPGSCPRTNSSTGLWSYVSEGALDESTLAYLGARTSDTNVNAGRLEFSWTAPPTGILISKLELFGWLRIASVGGHYWSANPACYGFVNPAGTRYAGTTRTISTGSNINTNAVGPAGTFVRLSLGVWTTNPATGVGWTLGDLAAGTFLAGVAADSPNIPNANGGAGAHDLDVALLEFELTHTATSTTTETIRGQLSHEVCLRRSQLSMGSVVLPPRFAYLQPGDKELYYGGGAWPVAGDQPSAPWEVSPQVLDKIDEYRELPLVVTEAEYHLDVPGVTLHVANLREQFCSLRWPMVPDQGVDPNDNGVLYYDQGGGMIRARNQAGYARRPDGLYTDRGASATVAGLRYASYQIKGLMIEAGGSERVLLNNTFSQWGGGLPTSWTVAGVTVSQDTTNYLLDVAGLRSSCKIVTNPAGNFVYVRQNSAGWTAAHYGRVRLTFRSDDAAVPLNVQILRTSDGKAYNFTTGTWVAPMWNPVLGIGALLDYDSSLGLTDQVLEWTSPVFTSGGNDTLGLLVGYPSGASKTSIVHRADLVRSTDPAVPCWALVTTVGAAVTQVADAITLDNSNAYRFLSEKRGTAEVWVVPTFGHADMANGGVATVLASYREGTAVTDEYDMLFYERVDATNGKWVYKREVAGTYVHSAEWAVSGADLLTIGTTYPLAIRWTGSFEELGLAARTMDLFVAGARRARTTSGIPTASNNAAVVLPGRHASGGFFSGIYSRLVVNTFCLTDTEILRHQL